MPLLIDQKHTSLVVTISVSICKRVECLVEELLPGVEVDAVPEAVLQVLGELPPHEAGVPVGDVGGLLANGHDDVAKVGQGLVDVLGLGQSVCLNRNKKILNPRKFQNI